MPKTKRQPDVQEAVIENGLAMTQANLNALALGYDFEHRCMYLFGPLNEMTAYRFISGFKWLDRFPGPIHIILSSPGGEAGAGLAIYDTIRTANNPTLIEGLGEIASAAVPVLLAGTIRLLNPETEIMVHNASLEIDGSLSSPVVHSLSKAAGRLNNRYHEIIAERTGRSIKDAALWCAEETSFSAAEALKYGFADKILEARDLPKSFEQGLAEINAAAGVPLVLDTVEEKKSKKKAKKA